MQRGDFSRNRNPLSQNGKHTGYLVMEPKEKQNTVELYFMEARAKLIDIAAFMDRVERDGHTEDFRFKAFKYALKSLESENRVQDVLMSFSDPTDELIPAATIKAACGTWPEESQQ